MSDIKKQINKLVSTKMKNRNDRLAKVGDNTDEQGNVLTDYSLYFDGMADALTAAGVDEADARGALLAQEANKTELKLLEQRMNLEQELEDNE